MKKVRFLHRFACPLLAVLFALVSVSGQATPCDLNEDKTGTVTEIVAGDTLFESGD